MSEKRLNKIIADAGITSRRGADDLIASGRVSVDGLVIRELGAKFDPSKTEVMVDGETITQSLTKIYLALHSLHSNFYQIMKNDYLNHRITYTY